MERLPPPPIPRAATRADLETLRRIEADAGAHFADVGLREVSQHPPHDLAELAEAELHGLLWVIDDPAAGVVGFAMARRLEASLHLEELSVLASHGRRGLGAALVCHVAGAAKALGYSGLTLSTFSRVPWNAPYYARLGFRTVPTSELDNELLAIRRGEEERGLAAEQRVMMRLALDHPGPCASPPATR